jgi:hypothetical protein
MQMLVYLWAALAWSVAPLGWAGTLPGGMVIFDPSCSIARPDKVKTLKVHFARTRGVGDFNGFPDVDLDAKRLTAEERHLLRKLIANARFFDLSSSPKPPPYVPDPLAGYDLTVEMDGHKHSIWIVDSDVNKSLRPLIDWLTDRAKKTIQINFTKSGGIAGFHWTGTINSNNLSAEDARKLRQLIADARFFKLPAENGETHVLDGFGYSITVEMDGKRHTVQVFDDTAPTDLWPLIHWLSDRAILDRPAGK